MTNKHYHYWDISDLYDVKNKVGQIKEKYSDVSSFDVQPLYRELPDKIEMLADIEKLIILIKEMDEMWQEDHELTISLMKESYEDRM